MFPVGADGARAEEVGVAPYAAVTTPTVGITVPMTIEFADVLPTPAGSTTTASAELRVTTTDSASYSLYVYGADGNALKSLNPDTTQTIEAGAAATLEELGSNTWGYNLVEGTAAGTGFAALPTDDRVPIVTKDTSEDNAAEDTYTLALGAKVDSTMPSGTYVNTVTIAVVAEPAKLAFDGIQTMQEMTSAVCAGAEEGETVRLEDTRDGKLYWAAKLKDGNCWMTQNLDLDLSTEIALTPEDSDLAESWTPETTTEEEGVITWASDQYSWDLGEYVKADPSNFSEYCDSGSLKSLAAESCKEAGWTNVEGMTAMEEWRDDGVTIEGSTYDAHYLTGNLYQWRAATAGTSAGLGADAQSSICPKGWHLPSAGYSGSEYNQLVVVYGYTVGADFTTAPMFMFSSGFVINGALRGAGKDADYWSSTAHSENPGNAFDLGFSGGAGLFAFDYYGRQAGFAVRCMVSAGN